MTHLFIVNYSGRIIKASALMLEAVQNDQRKAFNKGMEEMVEMLKGINTELMQMWKRCSMEGFNSFRMFLMGVRNNPALPKGVLFEGVSSNRFFFRGSSGANDLTMPFVDRFFQLNRIFPRSPMTALLTEYMTYNP